MLDMTDQYNTQLSPEDEKVFQKWAQSQNKLQDLYDYDVRGLWKSGQANMEGHGPDTYKKPNHPTFSDESIYHGVDNHEGGHWEGEAPFEAFTPGRSNLEHYGPSGLDEYFRSYEPDVRLQLPDQDVVEGGLPMQRKMMEMLPVGEEQERFMGVGPPEEPVPTPRPRPQQPGKMYTKEPRK